MRNSSRRSWRQQNACRTSSIWPQTCGLTRTPRFFNAFNSGSESAAHSSTSTFNSATLRATDSVADGLRTNSLRPISLPCRRVTTSKRAAVSRTGDTRSCEMGIAIVTLETYASAMPAMLRNSNRRRNPAKQSEIESKKDRRNREDSGFSATVTQVRVAKRYGGLSAKKTVSAILPFWPMAPLGPAL